MQHRIVRALLSHYLSRGGYTGPVSVTLSRERYEIVRKRRKHTGAAEATDCAATLLGPRPLVWFNVSRHATIAKLATTARHEAAHILSGDQEHGPDFQRSFRALRFEA